MHRNQYKVTQTLKYSQGDHSPDNVKFSDNSLTVCGTPPWHSSVVMLSVTHITHTAVTAITTSVTVSGGVEMQQCITSNHIFNS